MLFPPSVNPNPQGGFEVVVGAAVPAGYLPGALWSLEFHVPGDLQPSETIVIEHTAGSYNGVYPPNVLPTVVLHVIPEPMTIALLGLGGLLLHRRR